MTEIFSACWEMKLFTFDTQNNIDLGTFAAKAGNLYDDVEFADNVKTIEKLPTIYQTYFKGGRGEFEWQFTADRWNGISSQELFGDS